MCIDYLLGWITFAVAALLQGCLLTMCITWKFRQNRLGIDDFGRQIHDVFPPESWSSTHHSANDNPNSHISRLPEVDEDPMPGLVTDPSENPVAVRQALENALEAAAETDLRSPGPSLATGVGEASERSPLLPRQVDSSATSKNSNRSEGGWLSWFGR